jgi:hypothetical protein
MFKRLKTEIQQPLSALRYAGFGALLFSAEYLPSFGVKGGSLLRPWQAWSSLWMPRAEAPASTALSLSGLAALCLIAFMFASVGLLLTVRRLRATGGSPWFSLLCCVPGLNLVLFAILILLPSRRPPQEAEWEGPSAEHALKSIGWSALIVVPSAVFLIWLTTSLHASYGNGLFLGFPFALGFTSVTIYNWREVHGFGESIGVACFSVFCVGCSLLVLGMEGLICLFMALLIGLPFAFLGGALAYLVVGMRDTRNAIAGALLLVPFLAPQEMKLHHGPEHYQVRSSIEIAAPPERVWEHVIAFSEITEKPDSPMLRSGIAYPIHATISGRGVGAVRECIFTTGAFEEPIDVWDAPYRLHFTVAKQPPVMREMSWIPNLQPEHISREYLRSRQGQFVLTRLPNGHTRLEGTTWYELSYWPSSYWHLWSDAIIHRIHMRVLEHIKTEVERG